jgi:hypothetical protein
VKATRHSQRHAPPAPGIVPFAETRETPDWIVARRPDLLIPVIRPLIELTEDASLLPSESKRTA